MTDPATPPAPPSLAAGPPVGAPPDAAAPAVYPAGPVTGASCWAVDPALVDPVPTPVTVPLDGALERGRLPAWLTVLLALIGGFVATNLVGLFGAVLLLLPQLREMGGDPATMMTDLEGLMGGLMERAGPFLTINAVGQVLGFAVLAWALARWSSRSRPGLFLRLRAPELAGLLLAVIGLFALTPVVQWLGSLTSTLPLPEWLQELEDTNGRILERALVGSGLSPLFLLATMAVTPAVCEELLFRGYMHRQAERAYGPLVAIVGVGILFGVFHLSPTKALPLSVLGMWLGYVTWATGSLWPAVAVHFLNNAFAVAASVYVDRTLGGNPAALESTEVPLWLVAAGVAGTLGAGWALRRRHAALAGAALARTAPAATSPLPVSSAPPSP